MPPRDRLVISFAAEPPQAPLASGRWAEILTGHFLRAVVETAAGATKLGRPEKIAWFPDRTYAGRTYVPGAARTSRGFELFGYVAFRAGANGPSEFAASADFTSEVAEANPGWRLDLNEEVIGRWRGERGHAADITLIWGTPLIAGGVVATAELTDVTVDQCDLMEERFTLIGPAAYRGETLEIKLWSRSGEELASESPYLEDA